MSEQDQQGTGNLGEEATLARLAAEGVAHELVEHPAVWTMEDVEALDPPHPGADAKNLLVRDDKKRGYYLLTVQGDKRVDLGAFRKAHGLRRLSLASPADLERLLGLYPGAVTPLGLLNDAAHRVRLYLDEHLVKGPEDSLLGVHPNDNTATVYLRAADLVDLMRADGAAVEVVPFWTRPTAGRGAVARSGA